MERGKIGFITGLKAEARWLAGAGFMVKPGGGTPLGAQAAAETLVREGAQALVSFGVAGGLKPGLAPGYIMVPPAVLEGNRAYLADYALMSFLGGSTGGAIYAGLKIAATAHDKALLYLRGAPEAVDLESGAVGRVAQARGLPFAVLRAIADPAEADMPPAALAALNADGGLNAAAIFFSILRRPGQIPALLRLGRDTNAARAGLLARLKTLPERTF